MILSETEIFNILETNPNKSIIDEATKRHLLLNTHVNGVGVHEHLSSLKDYETKLQKEVGKNIIESNKGLFSSLLKPIDKVFSAKGESKKIELSERSKDEFINKLNNVAHGLPIRKWIEKKIVNKYITDPNGLIFIEVSDEKAKPTFKSITSIYDYKVTGQKVEYIVFKPQKIDDSNKLYFRVVDDVKDYYIESSNDNFRIIEEQTFDVHFKSCPAIVVSDIFDDVHNIKSSFVYPSLEKANTFLYDHSIHLKHKLLFGFAKYWEYGRDCLNCSGSGYVTNTDNESVECPSCLGSGIKSLSDVSDKLIAPMPTDKEEVILNKFSGFETPDLEIWKQYKEDLKEHKEELFKILWNVSYTSSGITKTATQSVLEVQPINDKLPSFSDNFERIESFVIDNLGYFYYEDQYKGAIINYGRRYLVESPDVIWEKLTTAKNNKMPTAFLLNLTKEYIQSLYSNNETELMVQMKLLKLEPFLFMTTQEVLSMPLSDEEKKRKIYFSEWFKMKDETELMIKTKEELSSEFIQYINTKTIENETPIIQ